MPATLLRAFFMFRPRIKYYFCGVMQQKTVHLAEEIKLKVMHLIAQNDGLKSELVTLRDEHERLKSEIQQQKNTIETLQTQNKIVKLAETLSSQSGDTKELKQQLQSYIKQLDECIRLLSE